MASGSHGSIHTLQLRLLGIGRRTTAPVTPLTGQHGIKAGKTLASVAQEICAPNLTDNKRIRAKSSSSQLNSPSDSRSTSRTRDRTNRQSLAEDDNEEEELCLQVHSPQQTSLPHTLVKEGLLKKRSPAGLKMWQSRWCELYSDRFIYCKRKSDTVLGSISFLAIRSCRCARDRRGKLKSSGSRFEVCVGEEQDGRVFHLEAINAQECDEWVEAINQACKAHILLLAVSTPSIPPATSAVLAIEPSQSRSIVPIEVARDRSEPSVSKISLVSSSRASRGPEFLTLNVNRLSMGDKNTLCSADIHQRSLSPSFMSVTLGSMHSPTATVSPFTRSYLPSSSPPPFHQSDPELSPNLDSHISLSSVLTASPLGPRCSLQNFTGSNNGSGRTHSHGSLDSLVEVVHSNCQHTVFLLKDKIISNRFYSMFAVAKNSMPNCCLHGYEAFAQVDHPSILKAAFIGESSDAVFYICTPPFRPTDTFLTLTQEYRRLPEIVVKHAAISIISALSYLHNLDLCYPVLSPSTVAFDGDGRATLCTPISSKCSEGHDNDPIEAEYWCPVSMQQSTESAEDWWRLGILLYELACGIPPIRSAMKEQGERERDIRQQLTSFNSSSLAFPPFVSSEFCSFVRQLLIIDPSARLGCGSQGLQELNDHPWLQGADGEASTNASITSCPQWLQENVLDIQPTTSFALKTVHQRTNSISSTLRLHAAHHQRSVTQSVVSVGHHRNMSTALSSPSPASPQNKKHTFLHSHKISQAAVDASDSAANLTNSFLSMKRPPVRAQCSSSGRLGNNYTLQLCIIGARHLHLPRDENIDSFALRSCRSKRLTWNKEDARSLQGREATLDIFKTGVFCAVRLGRSSSLEESQFFATRLVIGSTTTQPSFGDSFTLQTIDYASLLLVEVRQAKMGTILITDDKAFGVLVGSVIIPLETLHLKPHEPKTSWHSIIDADGMVSGELHVSYELQLTETDITTSPAIFHPTVANPIDQTFARLFNVSLGGVSEFNQSGSLASSISVTGPVFHEGDASRSIEISLMMEEVEDTTTIIEPFELELLEHAGICAADIFKEEHAESVRDVLTSARRSTTSDRLVDLCEITPQVLVMSRPELSNERTNTLGRNHLDRLNAYISRNWPSVLCVDIIEAGANGLCINCDQRLALAWPRHGVPSFDSLLRLCQDGSEWMSVHKHRAITFQCTSGIWRSCFLAACLLLWERKCVSVEEALALISHRRSVLQTSSEITMSQRRYMGYILKTSGTLKRATATCITTALNLPSLVLKRALELTHTRISFAADVVSSTEHKCWRLKISSLSTNECLWDSGLTRSISQVSPVPNLRVLDLTSSGQSAPLSSDCILNLECDGSRLQAIFHISFLENGYMKLSREQFELIAESCTAHRLPSSLLIEMQFVPF